MATTKAKTVCIDAELLSEFITKLDDMNNMIETLEVSLDKKLLMKLDESRADVAAGRVTKIRTAKELDAYLASLR